MKECPVENCDGYLKFVKFKNGKDIAITTYVCPKCNNKHYEKENK